MMRSEKRRRSAPLPSSGTQPDPQRPPQRKKPRRAGTFYIAVTMLLLLVLWPIGLIFLWRGKLRWGTLTKLFVSVITMMSCILLLGALLTVETGDPNLTAIQNQAIGYLDSAADALVELGSNLGERADQSLYALNEIRALYQGPALNFAADAIDAGVEAAMNVRAWAGDLFEGSPDESAEGPSGDGASPSPTPSAESVGGNASTASARPTANPTSHPAARITVRPSDETLPVYIPEAEPETANGIPLSEGMLKRSGELEPGALPTPTPEPTPEVYHFSIKPASMATVYFNIGSGEYYHMAPVCGSMKGADAHTLAEANENIHTPCERCSPPDKSILNVAYVAWVDENDVVHTTDDCPKFSGRWTLIPARTAIDAKFETCDACDASRYLAALADGAKITLEPYAAPATSLSDAVPTTHPAGEITARPTQTPDTNPTSANP